jgi:hypothetical protein
MLCLGSSSVILISSPLADRAAQDGWSESLRQGFSLTPFFGLSPALSGEVEATSL